MSKFSINKIEGNGNVFGDNSIISNQFILPNDKKNMLNKEEVIRLEAQEFMEYEFPKSWSYSSQQFEFIEKLRYRLNDFKTDENRSIFLDEVKNSVNQSLNSYKIEDRNIEHYGYVTTQRVLFFVEQEIELLPQIVHPNKNESKKFIRNSVFVSYSHLDKAWLDDLKRHFKPLIRDGNIDFWDDSRIEPSQKWKKEIEVAINRAKVAILLISADFFASDFIDSDELPKLLKAAEEDGTILLNIFLKPCVFQKSRISEFQGMNFPSNPVMKMSELEKEELWTNLVSQVMKHLSDEPA